MAISCEFGMLSYAHEILIYCGEQIDPVSESRYAQLFRKFSDFDLANRQPPKPSESFESYEAQEVQKRLRKLGPDAVCKDPDYPELRRVFFRYVSDEGVTAVQKLLSVPRNPNQGDCF